MLRRLPAQLSTYLCSKKTGIVPRRNFSSLTRQEEIALEDEAERKIGWGLKLFFAGTATFFGYQIFPYLGDSLIQQSVSLLHVKDPLYKRMGASRLARFAIDDERRMKIVEIGGAQQLVNMLGAAKDDKTRMEALKALSALSHSVKRRFLEKQYQTKPNIADKAAGALHEAGAISVIRSAPDSIDDKNILIFKSILLKRFQDLKYDVSS